MHEAAAKSRSGRNSDFGLRAQRYRRAMELFPNARRAELTLPLAVLESSPQRGGLCADLMGGTGFLGGAVAHLFDRVVVVDESFDLLDAARARGLSVRPADLHRAAPLWGQEAPRAVVCMAALHHVVRRDAQGVSARASHAHQRRLLQRLYRALPVGGILIIGDVGASGAGRSITNGDGQPSRPAPWARPLLRVVGRRGVGGLSLQRRTAFFRALTHRSSTGHEAAYPRFGALANCFGPSADVGVVASLNTPWSFSSWADAGFFIHELFGMGKRAFQTPSSMRREDLDEPLRILREDLGATDPSHVPWTLDFLVAVKGRA